MTGRQDVSAQWITEDGGLEALLPEWNALWRAHPRSTPFQAPAWQHQWWRSFRPGRLAVLTLRIGASLAAVLPFVAGDDDMRLLGAGVTDVQDALFDPYVRDLIPQALKRDLPRGVSIVLDDLPDDAALLSLPAPPDWSDRRERFASCPTLGLPAGASALADVLPMSMLRNLRHAHHRAERQGGWSAEPAGASTLDGHLDILFELHGKRWRRQDLPGALSTAEVRAFHRAAARDLLAAGALRLTVFRLGGRVAAAYYGFHHGAAAYYYLSGFDPDQAYANPGTLAVGHAIAEALAGGARAFNFLRGREAYKYRWGAVDTVAWRRVLTAG